MSGPASVRPARQFGAPAPDLPAGPYAGQLQVATAGAPYLARLCGQYKDIAAAYAEAGPQVLLDQALARAEAAGLRPQAEATVDLRWAKAALHLACAGADLAGDWSVQAVTGALSQFADVAVRSALKAAAAGLVARGDLSEGGSDPARGPVPGFVILALGKHGAGELNYSSDMDISVFYQPELIPVGPGREPRQVAIRLTQALVALLEQRTEHGYVFRTDLRLRPDPASTPIAVAIPMAEAYYQSVGQNWERAAFIKARAVAGDPIEAAAFLDTIARFVWRRSLDYAAIADVQSIKRQILATHKSADLSEPVFDVKLGRGGIRDIELFVQTQQLILGGRDGRMRQPTTLGALAALTEVGHVQPADQAGLTAAYRYLRAVEHRIQMIGDEQTHKVPADAAGRERLAALCGAPDRRSLEHDLVRTRAVVVGIDKALFPDAPSLADPLGSLIFTGVEDSAETLDTLSRLGFERPEAVSGTIRGWHHGRVRCMRSERARQLLTDLTPALIRAWSDSGDPDAAFSRFAAFFDGLISAVTVLSLFKAQPQFLARLARALAASAPLAGMLAQRPALLDAMIDPLFDRPLAIDPAGERAAAFAALAITPFEAAINAARRLHREQMFRIHMALLAGTASARDAGLAHADLADACVQAISAAAHAETLHRFGPAPGRFVVAGLGKFGGQELAAGSDLDLMVIYAPAETPGARLSPADWFTRFTQRLIAGLSAPTEEGRLYEVDMQLRPSGSKGPVAVALAGFERYYTEDAWTWELLALTRIRAVTGDAALASAVHAAAEVALRRPRDPAQLLTDVADMRARMHRERPAKGPLDLKLRPGGFVDLEFLVQTRTLLTAPTGGVIVPGTAAALAAHAPDVPGLHRGFTLLSDLQQLLRLVCGNASGLEDVSQSGLALLLRAAGVGAPAELTAALDTACSDIGAAFVAQMAGAGDGRSGTLR